MKVLKKISLSLIAVSMAVAMSACTFSAPASFSLPPLAEVMSATDTLVANDLNYELEAAKRLPRVSGPMQTASVEIVEIAGMVVVEASRLPAIEHFADAGLAGARGNSSR